MPVKTLFVRASFTLRPYGPDMGLKQSRDVPY